MKTQSLFCCAALLFAAQVAAEEVAPDYVRDVAPLFRKYCVGCHNGRDFEGKLSLETRSGALKGGESGAVIAPGKSAESKLIQALTGQAEPAMPPEGEKAPSAEEIALLARWIDFGAAGPEGADDAPLSLNVPRIDLTAPERRPINAAAFSPDGQFIALARYGEVELLTAEEKSVAVLTGLPGHVNAVCFSPDGARLAAAAGEPGLFGEVRIWSVADYTLLQTLRGHKDSIYALDFSPDGRLLATGSYDRDVKLWDLSEGKEIRTLSNHNGAVFGVAFHPGGHLLATASADRTVKLWNLETGARLDTFEQSTKELYTLAFFPDGKRLAAAGADNRIRVWGISETGAEGTNPLLVSQFGHEKAILRLGISRDGATLVSTAEDRDIKIWDGATLQLRETLETQPDWTSGLAVSPDGTRVFAGRLDGSLRTYPITKGAATAEIAATLTASELHVEPANDAEPMPQLAESEPNDDAAHATPLSLPGTVKGKIFVTSDPSGADADCYRIGAKQGETWILETKAARNGSPVDTKIEIRELSGEPVPHTLLRAVRDSWITFRGINSDQLDVRLVNWEEMQLNQYLFANGEVTKLFRAPQGPDSGFQLYPGAGKRKLFFDTSALSHPVDEPCYIVQPYAPGALLPNNGLPTFTLYYENDDESRQAFGKDSFLTFTPPHDGEYLVRVVDVRGLSGEKFDYELVARRPRPDFKVTLGGADPTIAAGSGKRFTLTAERLDGFDGEIRIDLEGLPPGFSAPSPLIIQAGHLEARGVVSSAADAPAPTEENQAKTKVLATAAIGGQDVTHEVGTLGAVKLSEKPKLIVRLTPTADANAAASAGSPDEVVIRPGTTVTCQLSIERNGFTDRVQFDVDNLPHGVIVDNIGLNGVLIPEGMDSRVLYLTAADWVPETRRQFFAVAKAEGEQASLPLWLRVEANAPGK